MTLLPSNSTQFELAAEEALSEREFIQPALLEIRGIKYARPLNETIAPWLVLEYGLGPISQFFDNFEDLIDEGRVWQRIRGTPQAVKDALGWVDYDNITILDQVPSRRRWHLYQANMGELPLPNEDQRLANAEFLAGLSDSSRNYFWRGFYGYDVRVHVWGRSRWGRSIWGTSSGVRINGGMTYWSHGRTHQIGIDSVGADYAGLGFGYTSGQELTWDDDIPWDAEGVTWDGVESSGDLIAWFVKDIPVYLGLYDANDDVIGYIKNMAAGILTEDTDGSIVNYDIRTGFGDGSGLVVDSVSIVFGGQNSAGVKPFKRFLLPSQVTFEDGPVRVGSFSVDITTQKTIREFFKVALLIED